MCILLLTYYVVIIFCYKTSDSKKKKVKLVIVKCIFYVWMSVVMWVNINIRSIIYNK